MQRTDAIIILGHRLEPDDTPSKQLIRRIDCAVEHWKETNAPIVMPCGGITPGHKLTEAQVMREMLIERGVPAEIIRLEDRSRITIENILNAKMLLGEDKTVAVVTSDHHLPRAMEDCERIGLKAYGVGAVTPPGPERDELFANSKRIAQEMAAYHERGMSDQEIVDSLVGKMRQRGAVTIEEVEAVGERE